MSARMTETFGANHFVPFSSFHRYQRADSVWANEWTTSLAEYGRGFRSDTVELLPAFVRYDCATDLWEGIDPAPAPDVAFSPEEFGDDWSTPLDGDDVRAVTRYFAVDRAARTHARPRDVPGRRPRARGGLRWSPDRAARSRSRYRAPH